jgi:hypothetical protein
MVYEGRVTCSHTGMLVIVYVVVFWRNKSADFILEHCTASLNAVFKLCTNCACTHISLQVQGTSQPLQRQNPFRYRLNKNRSTNSSTLAGNTWSSKRRTNQGTKLLCLLSKFHCHKRPAVIHVLTGFKISRRHWWLTPTMRHAGWAANHIYIKIRD